ncbi:MAG: hypothetical protein AB7I79_14720 [Rhizobiaceae bacterium]
MDVIETAIRNAFEKGDSHDRAYRERVYRSAFAALDRALKANPGVTVETAIARRKNLQSKIAEIESEYIPAVPEADPRHVDVRTGDDREGVAPAVEVAADVGRAAPMVEAPVVGRATAEGAPEVAVPGSEREGRLAGRGPERLEPSLASQADGSDPRTGDDDFAVPAQTVPNVDTDRRRPYAVIFVLATVVALVAIGGWWAVTTGLFKSPDEIGGEVPNPPATTEDEDFDPDEEEIGAPSIPGEADVQYDWMSVFTPADPTVVSAPGDAQAEVMQDDGGSFMRIRSGQSGSAIVFDVGQGVLERLAGRKALFDIVARSAEEGQETQISVICNFGELGDCGRKRYAVGSTRADYLFEIELPRKEPGAAGTIAINSDIEGAGKAIDIFEIRAAVVP